MQLKDGALLAAHPQRLFDRIQKDAKEVTLKEARALGADERSFVSLKDLIERIRDVDGFTEKDWIIIAGRMERRV